MAGYILMVDDDWFLGDIVGNALQKRGWTVNVATSGERALELARESAPTMMLLDLGLPDGDGWALLKRLREEALDAGTPVVVVSALPVTRTQLRTHRVTAYVPKPFSVNRLLEVIHALGPERRG